MHGTITSMKIVLHFNIAKICIIYYFVKVHVPWQFLSEAGKSVLEIMSKQGNQCKPLTAMRKFQKIPGKSYTYCFY